MPQVCSVIDIKSHGRNVTNGDSMSVCADACGQIRAKYWRHCFFCKLLQVCMYRVWYFHRTVGQESHDVQRVQPLKTCLMFIWNTSFCFSFVPFVFLYTYPLLKLTEVWSKCFQNIVYSICTSNKSSPESRVTSCLSGNQPFCTVES